MDEVATISLRISRRLLAELDELAAREEVPRSFLVRRAIRSFLRGREGLGLVPAPGPPTMNRADGSEEDRRDGLAQD